MVLARSLLLITIVLVGFRGETQAENWPEFRGPTGQGHSSARGLPVRWSDTENVRWKKEIPGNAWSSPVVSNGLIYLTTAVPRETGNPYDQSLRALCLDAATGSVQWNVEVFSQEGQPDDRIQGKNSHASPTPIIDDGHLYVHFGTEGTACLKLDGTPVWKSNELVYDPRHGNGGSPVLINDVLVIICDGADQQFVVALDRRNGKIRWQKPRPRTEAPKKFAFSTPLVIEAAGSTQVICPGADIVVAHDPADGRELWLARYEGYSVVPRPVYGHGLLFISTSFNDAKLLAIRPDGEGDVTKTHVAWRARRGIPHTPSMLIEGDELYSISDRGVAKCVDARTGDIHWQKRIGGNFSASPFLADGKIYFQSEEGDTTVIQTGKRYEELAKNTLGARTLASYAVTDSALLIRTATHLYRIEKL
jgi:outer membrane protein assembly factor BamB